MEEEKAKVLESLTGSIYEHNDVEIILEDGVIKASKMILSRRSEYFQRMFDKNSHFEDQRKISVRFSCKKLIMRKIIEHLYVGDLAVSGLSCLDIIELMNMLRYLLLEEAVVALVDGLDDLLNQEKFYDMCIVSSIL